MARKLVTRIRKNGGVPYERRFRSRIVQDIGEDYRVN